MPVVDLSIPCSLCNSPFLLRNIRKNVMMISVFVMFIHYDSIK